MLYYSQGKGDTDEKVKTLRPEAENEIKQNQYSNQKSNQQKVDETILNKTKIINRRV